MAEPQNEKIVLDRGNSGNTQEAKEVATLGLGPTLIHTGGSTAVEARINSASNSQGSRPRSQVILSMTALCMAVFLAALDQTIITTALPAIARGLNASEADYAWVGSTYLLAGAAVMPCWGKISDIFGRKPVLLITNAVFFVGSLICALSSTIGMLEGGRVIQGAGAGGLMTLVNICISDMFSMRDRGMYMGIIGLVFAFASSVGPIIGGAFAEYVTWRWGFYINLPFDGVAFGLVVIFLDLKTPKTPLIAGIRAIDWAGSLLIVGGTTMFLIGLGLGGVSYAWTSPTVLCLLIFGLLAIGLFILAEAKVAYPIMPLRILKNRSNIAALLANFAHGLVFFSGSFYLPVYFQAVLGATPLQSGAYLLPFIITLSLMAAASGIFIKKSGQYLPLIIFGLGCMTLGFGFFINFPSFVSWSRIIIFQIIAGVGVGCLFQSPLVALQAQVARSDVASVTATFGFSRNLSTAMSVMIGGAILQNEISSRVIAAQPDLSESTFQSFSSGALGQNTNIVSTLPQDQKAIIVEIYTQSLQVLWIFYTAVAFAGFLISFAISRKRLDTQHTETKTGLDIEKQNRLARLQSNKRMTLA